MHSFLIKEALNDPSLEKVFSYYLFRILLFYVSVECSFGVYDYDWTGLTHPVTARLYDSDLLIESVCLDPFAESFKDFIGSS
ncbi:hypothetical protein SDC9_189446 [bioreactor metagenome]|uniref:Uncharacterized protein n=1 Tax=bioreactor metagenome TaxID=1076179 RepID=A0A645HS65_9ZZZZ